MTPELELALLRSADRTGTFRELCCPSCLGVLGPRRVAVPLTCERCGAVFSLADSVGVQTSSSK